MWTSRNAYTSAVCDCTSANPVLFGTKRAPSDGCAGVVSLFPVSCNELTRVWVVPWLELASLSHESDVSNVAFPATVTPTSTAEVSSISPTPIPSGASSSNRPTNDCSCAPCPTPSSKLALNPESRVEAYVEVVVVASVRATELAPV